MFKVSQIAVITIVLALFAMPVTAQAGDASDRYEAAKAYTAANIGFDQRHRMYRKKILEQNLSQESKLSNIMPAAGDEVESADDAMALKVERPTQGSFNE